MEYTSTLENCVAFLKTIAEDEQDSSIVKEYEAALESYSRSHNLFRLYRDLCNLRDKYHIIMYNKHSKNIDYSGKFIAPIASLRLNLMRSC